MEYIVHPFSKIVSKCVNMSTRELDNIRLPNMQFDLRFVLSFSDFFFVVTAIESWLSNVKSIRSDVSDLARLISFLRSLTKCVWFPRVFWNIFPRKLTLFNLANWRSWLLYIMSPSLSSNWPSKHIFSFTNLQYSASVNPGGIPEFLIFRRDKTFTKFRKTGAVSL